MRAVMVLPCTTYSWSLLMAVKSLAFATEPMNTRGTGQLMSSS